MQSTTRYKSFTWDDFEKGLMLAGLTSPSTTTDLEERLQLEAHEKQVKNEKKSTYFKRVVLAAEIANNLHSEPTFGRIKFQKLVYLCEVAAEMNLEHRYLKQAAGPFDNKFMHSIEIEFKKNQWFEVEKSFDGKISRSKYKPLSRVIEYEHYFRNYFKDSVEAIQNIIELFRTAKTDKIEIAATLYACHIELINKSDKISITNLVDSFYAWSEKKKRFDQTVVLSIWNWMVEKKLVPEIQN